MVFLKHHVLKHFTNSGYKCINFFVALIQIHKVAIVSAWNQNKKRIPLIVILDTSVIQLQHLEPVESSSF